MPPGSRSQGYSYRSGSFLPLRGIHRQFFPIGKMGELSHHPSNDASATQVGPLGPPTVFPMARRPENADPRLRRRAPGRGRDRPIAGERTFRSSPKSQNQSVSANAPAEFNAFCRTSGDLRTQTPPKRSEIVSNFDSNPLKNWSGRWESNPRHSAWEADVHERFFNGLDGSGSILALPSGRGDSNARPPAWEAGALPLSYVRIGDAGGFLHNRLWVASYVRFTESSAGVAACAT